MKKELISAAVFFGVFGSIATGARENAGESVPTIVYGAAATPDGGENVMIVEQPKDAPNPLGNPLPDPVAPAENTTNDAVLPQPNTETPGITGLKRPADAAGQQMLQNRGNPPAEAEALGKDFQNTLMEADGMIYDVQAYPEQDLKPMSNPADPQTIYSPNVNN